MYLRPTLAPRRQSPRTSQTEKFSAATNGWIANQSLDSPQTLQGAELLDNWFPTATGQEIRRGTELYATLGGGTDPVTSIFDYNNGNIKRLFASTATTIYDITVVSSPMNYQLWTGSDDIVDDLGNNIGQLSTGGLEVVDGQSGGAWVTTQFATTGGVFLVAVNGNDPMQIYDGEYWFPIDQDDVYQIMYDAQTSPFQVGDTVTGGTSGATGYILHIESSGTAGILYITDVTGTFQDNETLTSANGSATSDGIAMPYYVGITGVDTSRLTYVWSYKNRLFFIEKDSLNVWYLPVDSIGGVAESFPMGGEFSEGGKLLFGSSWSLDSSGDGGLSEQCIFVTDEGQVSVYQGLSPEPDQGWSRVGVYKIGKPLGNLAHKRAGGDIIIATDIGDVPLSQAINRDVAALAPGAVSYAIETEWNITVQERRFNPWHCVLWPERQMAIVAPPTGEDQPPMVLVANARTGAWTRFTGWDVTCMCVYDGRLFFGSKNGKVIEAYVTGMDEGLPFTASFVPLFRDLGSPMSLKIGKMGRAVLRGAQTVNDQVSMMTDYIISLPPSPAAAQITSDSVWGEAVWGQSVWGGRAEKQIQQRWASVGGAGYAVAPGLQITSGSLTPLDTELIRLELSYTAAEVVS